MKIHIVSSVFAPNGLLLAVLAFASPDVCARSSSEYSLTGGALLPHRIERVDETLPIWDLRASARTRKGMFEFDASFANAEGVNYKTASVDYRYDLENSVLPVFLLLGVQGDDYQGVGASSEKFTGGWNFGGGFFLPIAGPLALRADFRYRFGPGTSLLALVGLAYMIQGEGTP